MAGSVISAVLAKYDTLTFTPTRPPIYFGEAPLTDAAGAQERVPYCVLIDNGTEPDYQSDYGGTEGGSFVLQVYDTTLTALDILVKVIKFNGQPPASKAGLDFCSLTVDPPLYFVSLHRVSEQRSYAGFNQGVERVHLCELTYRVVTELRASG